MRHIGTLVAFAAFLGAGSLDAQPRRMNGLQSRASPATESAMALGVAFSDTADRVVPAVVALYVEVVQRSNAPMLQDPQGFSGMPMEEPQRRTGSGSGVLIREDGVIVTNHHVVEGASRIRVRLADGRVFPGRLLGADPATDLAVVKIEATGLPTARIGDSEAARVGEWVLAVGAPFGLEHTVTHGVISAKGRGGLGVNQIEDYLQTDASINPGNSGGALVNLRGEVLGINTMVVGRGQGIGFAVPSRLVDWVTRQILARGRVIRGWIGVHVQEISPDLARAFGGVTAGALVSSVNPSSPAHGAGMVPGDVVSSVNGTVVHNRHELIREIASRGINERLTLVLTRNGQRRSVNVTTALRPGEPSPTEALPAAPPQEQGPAGFGVRIDVMPAAYSARLGLQPGVGVLIIEVLRGGAADRAGLRPGDVVLQVDGREARGPQDVIDEARDGRAVMLVRRGGAQEFVGLEVQRPDAPAPAPAAPPARR